MDLIKMAKRNSSFKTLLSEFWYLNLQPKLISQQEKSSSQDNKSLGYGCIKDIMKMPRREVEK